MTAGSLFRQIAASLADAIESGELPVGTRLPTEATLARRHGVSRHTVREALGELRAQGLIESRQGRGSVVIRARAQTIYTQAYSSIDDLTRVARGMPLHPTRVGEVTADAALAGLLRGSPGRRYIHIEALRFASDDTTTTPAGHVEVFVDGTFGRIRDHLQDLRVAVAEKLEELYDLRIVRIEQEITVEALGTAHAATLDVAPGTPALLIRRWYSAANGRIFEIAISRYPVGRFAMRNVLTREGTR